MNFRHTLLTLAVGIFSLLAAGSAAAQSPTIHALFKAAESGDAQAVQQLLAQGLPADAADPEGRTALLLAARAGKLNTAYLLVRAWANVNARSARGETPLMAAAGSGNTELVRLLLYKGALRTATSAQGLTAADHARRANFPELANLLEPQGETAGVVVVAAVAAVAAAATASNTPSGKAPPQAPDDSAVGASAATSPAALKTAARPSPAEVHPAPAEKSRQTGAPGALQALRNAQLSLDAIDETTANGAYRDALAQALRGESGGAQRIAAMYRQGANGLAQNAHRAEQWLQVAAALGSGDASWQLAKLYNRAGQVGEAARFEAQAVESGYRVPVRLPTRALNF